MPISNLQIGGEIHMKRLDNSAKMCIIALDWTGLDWTGLDWTGLDWTGLDWTGLDWTG